MRAKTTARLMFAFASVATVFAVGCGARPQEAPDYLLTEGSADDQRGVDTPPSAAPAAAAVASASDGETGPVVIEETEPADPAEGSMDMDAGIADAGDPDASTAPMIVTKSGTCTSSYGSHRSVTKLTWTVDGKKVTIKSLAVTVTNPFKRNKNDVDVWVRPPGGGETKAFNSGDVLPNGKTITVKLPSGFASKTLSTKIRIETNFDQEGSDPSASCTITLS
jgi:hypothetical protein